MTIIEALQGDLFYYVLAVAILGLLLVGYNLARFFFFYKKKPKKFINMHDELRVAYGHLQESARGVQRIEDVLMELE